jgi:hypothetical protein
MQDAKIESLAHTLKVTGLCSSVNDALRMASTIIGTEQKVSSGFNRYNEVPVKKKMTYQEEIDDLIRKTSPEYKNYHVPIKGYKRDVQPEREVFYELEQGSSTSQKVVVKAEIKPEITPVVYTDAFEPSQKSLNEMMTVVDHGDVCANEVTIAPSLPEVQEVTIIPSLPEVQEEKSEEFIVSEEKLPSNSEGIAAKEPESVPILSEKKEEKEELFKEIKEDKSKPHEVKNPIQAVDLMSYFKAG